MDGDYIQVPKMGINFKLRHYRKFDKQIALKVKTTILFLAGILFVSLNSFAQNGPKVLLNKAYKVRVVEDYNTPDSNSWKDEIIFKNNKLYFLVFFEKLGLPIMPSVLFSVDSTNAITFTSEVRNDDDDDRILNGTITGDAIVGFVQIRRNDHVIRPYSFSGKIK